LRDLIVVTEPHQPPTAEDSLRGVISVPVHSRKNASGSSQLKINGEQRIRKSTLKPDEWAGVKSIVKQLYIDQGKTLEEVLDILMQEHNFEARFVPEVV
jgi:hypothetical protein